MVVGQGIASNQRVLLIWTSAKEDQVRFSEALRGSPAEIAAECVEQVDEFLELAPKRKPLAIVVDWNVAPPEQLAVMLQKLRSNPFLVLTPLYFLLSGAPDRAAMAMAGEYGMRGLMFSSSLASSLPRVLNEIAVDATKPSSMRSLLNKIEVAAARNNIGELDTAALDLFTLFPNETRAQVEYANLCIRRADWGKAKEIASKILEKDKTNLRARNTLIRVLLREKKFDEATALLTEAEDLSPGNVGRMVLLGDLYRERGNNADARRKYGEALEVVPDLREARQGEALVSLSEGDINTALTMLKETSSQEEIGSFFNDAAILAIRNRRLDDALSLYSSALSVLEKKNLRARVHFNTGLAHYKFEQQSEAISCFRQASETDPEFSRAREALAQLGVHEAGRPAAPSSSVSELPREESLTGSSLEKGAMSELASLGLSEKDEGWAPWNAPVPAVKAEEPPAAAPGTKKASPARAKAEEKIPAFIVDKDD
jgi:tetratricopeptide (TPR) repeat protein